MSCSKGMNQAQGAEPVYRHLWRYSKVVEPIKEPVTLEEAKLFARIDDDIEDDLVTALITSARIAIEAETGRSFITQTYDAFLNFVPSNQPLRFSFRPIQSVESISAMQSDSSTVDVDPSTYILDGANAEIGLNGLSLSSDLTFNAFRVRYVAGYGDASEVPEWAKTAIKQLVTHMYEYRDSVLDGTIVAKIPFTTQTIIDANKVPSL